MLFTITIKTETLLSDAKLFSNTSGRFTTAMGYRALFQNTTGDYNTAFGHESLHENSTGVSNTANGVFALRDNTTGNANTALGTEALMANNTGWGNVGIGVGAAVSNLGGMYNTALGSGAMNFNVNGSENVAVGYNALSANLVSHNTMLGTFSDVTNVFNNATAVGHGALCNNNNRVWLGDAAVVDVWCATGTYLSDGRFKSAITSENIKGLEFILKLRPVTYKLEARKLAEFMSQNLPDSLRKQHLDKDFEPAMKARHTGFIAQEVAELADELNFNFSGVHIPEHNTDTYGLSYHLFVVPLVKGMQEQQVMINELKEKLASQERKLQSLINGQTDKIEQSNNPTIPENIKLGQNEPNPYSKETEIQVSLPENIKDAQLSVFDLSGKLLKSYALDGNDTTVKVNAGDLRPGILIYAVVQNGQILASRRMVISE